jgi:protein gp37
MSDKSAIEWTDATWNPVTGCSKVSPGCANCYAETLSLRFGHSKLPWTPANAAENVVLHPERLGLPLTWRSPRRVFVNSMSDLFHELVPDEYVDSVFAVMASAPKHTFQVLTKRPEQMARYTSAPRIAHAVGMAALRQIGPEYVSVVITPVGSATPGTRMAQPSAGWPLPNVWLGTSIENDRWTVRADALRETVSAVRFLSCEPLLGPLPSLDLTGIDWVIVGGESGNGHRPMDPDWVRDIRDRCLAAGVAFFFKQWGGRTPKSGGRSLDGRTWDEMPRTAIRV